MSEWQKIETAPMEDGDEYLVWDGYAVALVNVSERNWWCLAEFTIDAPTHWMPLPSPPKDGE